MQCCGYDRKTKFCSQCGKELQWNPKQIMLTYYRGRVKDLTDSLKWKRDENGQLKPEAQLTLNRIDQYTACIQWLTKQEVRINK